MVTNLVLSKDLKDERSVARDDAQRTQVRNPMNIKHKKDSAKNRAFELLTSYFTLRLTSSLSSQTSVPSLFLYRLFLFSNRTSFRKHDPR